MKVDCLVCLTGGGHSNHKTSCCTLGAIGKSLTIKDAMNWFQMFQPMVEKLLNIEQNFH
jgi:hypothetical protein